jgi:hypothetical protein
MPNLFATIIISMFFYFFAALFAMTLMAMWRINKTAKRPGWLALIPGVNVFVLHRIAGQPGWWTFLWFLPIPFIGERDWWILVWFIPIPLIRIFLLSLLAYGISVKFNKGALYTLGLTFLPFIFYPHIAFGNSEYYPDAE